MGLYVLCFITGCGRHPGFSWLALLWGFFSLRWPGSKCFFFISIYILYIFILASNLLKDILLKISMGSSNHFPNFEILRCGEGMGVRIKP